MQAYNGWYSKGSNIPYIIRHMTTTTKDKKNKFRYQFVRTIQRIYIQLSSKILDS